MTYSVLLIMFYAFVLLIWLGAVIPPTGSHDHEVLTQWEIERSSGDIVFSYRKVRVGDTLETKEMRMTFPVHAMPETMLPFFKDPDKFMSWSPDVDQCLQLEGSDSTWVLYKFYDMPWPIAERDIVTGYRLTHSDSMTHLGIYGLRQGYPLQSGVKRIEQYEAQWFLRARSDDVTDVEFRTVQLEKPVGPRALQERVVENSFIKSVRMLKELLEG